MKKTELEGKTRQQLLVLAGKAGLRGRHRLSRAQLQQALATAAKPARKKPAPEPTELPGRYGKTRLVLMEIEPYQLHAYWEVTPRDLQAATARLGDDAVSATWVLRFYDVTALPFDGTNAHSFFDVPVDAGARNWYVDLWASEKTYCAEIALRAATGRFLPLGRSNVVHTPRHEPSPRFGPAWAKVEQNQVERVPAPVTSAAIPASGEPIPQTAPASPDPSQVGAQRWSSLTVDAFSSAGPGSGGSAFPPADPAPIDLQLNAEVIVYGRGQPGQSLQINGHWVQVNADGTFRVQWALPVRKTRSSKSEIRIQDE